MYSTFKKRYLSLDLKNNDDSQQFESSPSPQRVKGRNIPSQRVALFDIILASVSSKKEDSSITPYSIGYSTQRFDNVTLQPKSFVVAKKKKSLSSLKKKILLGRLKRVLDKLKLDGAEDNNTLCIVHLYNFVTLDDIQESEDCEEICSNVRELLHSFGHIKSIKIFRPTNIPDYSCCYVAVTFSEANSASRATRSIDGLVFGGAPLQARLAASEFLALTIPSVSGNEDNYQKVIDPSQFKCSGSVVCLENMITASDVADPDEAAEVLSDIYSLCSAFGSIANIWIQKKAVDSKTNSEQVVVKTAALRHSDVPWGLVEYSDIEDAIHSINILNKRLVGGEILSATLFDYTAFSSHDYGEENIILLESAYQETFAVRLLGFVERKQLEDEDEIQEIINDIQSIFAEKVPGLSITSIYFVNSNTQDDVLTDVALDAIVSLPTLHDALVLARFLGQQVISGEALAVHVEALRHVDSAEILSAAARDVFNSVLHHHQCSKTSLSGSQQQLPSLSLVTRRLYSSHADGAVVLVKNYFLADDLIDARGKSEDMAALKRDLLQLTRGGPPYTEKGIVRRILIIDDSNTPCPHLEVSDEKVLEEFAAVIEFQDDASAEEALLNLDGMVIGGSSILALRQKYQPSGSVEDGGQLSTAESSRKENDPHSYSSEDCTYECVYSQSASGLCPELGKVPEDGGMEDGVEHEPLKTHPSSKYADAKTAPRAPCHEITKQFIPSATEEIDELIKVLLNLLASFQKRAKEANPLKAKQKQRFLAGIKQTTNAVKAGMVKLIFLAPNTEALDALDEKIDVLITEAQSKDIPICYCLNKRKLGKAAQLSMKQSVLSVVDPDGAYELYRKIIEFIRSTVR